ncbi:sulfatase-like hydrolase/transferase, partial [Sphingobacterium daejeonense]|uniref:sulfatase-like hydrolase/transferase n=1 Tax=Sphingobacterium daejeonense TaxID=371142 RepID=UPI003D31E78B
MCVPTRASLFTGLYPARHGAYQNHKPVKPNLKSVAHYLKDAGYRVGLTGKNHVTTVSYTHLEPTRPSY